MRCVYPTAGWTIGSEKVDKDVKEQVDLLNSEKMNLWELATLFKNPADVTTMKKIFPQTEQYELIKTIVLTVVAALDFHNTEDDSAHPSLDKADKDLAAKFRNHRHETGKNYSAKPEY